MPADFERSTVRKYAALNDRYDLPVREVYGSINPSPFGSGRKPRELPRVTLRDLQAYQTLLGKHGIRFNYTFNQLCNGNRELTAAGIREIRAFLRALIASGVSRVTVTIPVIIDIIECEFPQLEVAVSVICAVDSVSKLLAFGEYRCVRRVYIKEDLNRDFRLLRKMSERTTQELATIANTSCLMNCPYRTDHYLSHSHAAALERKGYFLEEYYWAKCARRKIATPLEMLRAPWIRPEDLDHYIRHGVSCFKITGRELRQADFARTAESYMKRAYDGNIFDLFMSFAPALYCRIFSLDNRELDGFIDRFLSSAPPCRAGLCDECGRCANLAEKIELNTFYLKEYRDDLLRNYPASFRIST